MGIRGNRFNGRSWTSAILTEGWVMANHSKGRLIWVTPLTLSESKGAGATVYYDIDHFFRDTFRNYTLSEEVPRYRIEDGTKTNCVARAIRSSDEEDPPNVQHESDIAQRNEGRS